MSEKYKKVLIAFGITLGITVVTFAVIFISYSQKLKNNASYGLVTTNTINQIVDNDNTAQASTTSDATVNEAMNKVLENFNSTNSVQGETLNSVSTASGSNTTSNENVAKSQNTEKTKESKKSEEEETAAEETKPVSFIAPVSGEILTDYAEENLIYSETLKEWTTHLGVDIKADKTSVVVASETGTVKSIKNDPRYGLTITISHNEGYETVYSNLLSSEFVNEGDKVTQGQTIGTVGESASFEVADVPHLHFEMYKDGKAVNPTNYFSE